MSDNGDVRSLLMAQTGRTYHCEEVELGDGSKHTFRLQSLTTSERAKYQASRFDRKTGRPKELEDMQVRLVQLTLVDDQNNLVLRPTDRQALLSLDGRIVGQLYEAAFEHCRLAPRFMEDEAKNSSETDEDATSAE